MASYLYLVTLSHSMDDIPLRIFEDREQAFSFGETVEWDAPADLLQRLELPDCSTPICITITTFENGIPISRVILREVDEEADYEGDGE